MRNLCCVGGVLLGLAGCGEPVAVPECGTDATGQAWVMIASCPPDTRMLCAPFEGGDYCLPDAEACWSGTEIHRCELGSDCEAVCVTSPAGGAASRVFGRVVCAPMDSTFSVCPDSGFPE